MILILFLYLTQVWCQKLKCAWEPYLNTTMVGRQVAVSTKLEHAKAKCKTMGESCTGVEEYQLGDGSRTYKLKHHTKLGERNGGTVWVKRCEPCQSLMVTLKAGRNDDPAYWRVKTSFQDTAVLSTCFWMKSKKVEGFSQVVRDERILTIKGDKNLQLAAIRQRGDVVGFSIKVNDLPSGVVLDDPIADGLWHMVCLSLDDKNYLRFNLNGDTVMTQKMKSTSTAKFSSDSELLLGNDQEGTFGFKGQIANVNIYGSSMKEKEIKSIFNEQRDECNCERGDLFWISDYSDNILTSNAEQTKTFGPSEQCPATSELDKFDSTTTEPYVTTEAQTTLDWETSTATTSTTTSTTTTSTTTSTTTTTTTEETTTTIITTTTTEPSTTTTMTTTTKTSTETTSYQETTTSTTEKSVPSIKPTRPTRLNKSSTERPTRSTPVPSRISQRPAQDYFGNMTAGDSEPLTTTTTTTTTTRPQTILINKGSNDLSVEGNNGVTQDYFFTFAKE